MVRGVSTNSNCVGEQGVEEFQLAWRPLLQVRGEEGFLASGLFLRVRGRLLRGAAAGRRGRLVHAAGDACGAALAGAVEGMDAAAQQAQRGGDAHSSGQRAGHVVRHQRAAGPGGFIAAGQADGPHQVGQRHFHRLGAAIGAEQEPQGGQPPRAAHGRRSGRRRGVDQLQVAGGRGRAGRQPDQQAVALALRLQRHGAVGRAVGPKELRRPEFGVLGQLDFQVEGLGAEREPRLGLAGAVGRQQRQQMGPLGDRRVERKAAAAVDVDRHRFLRADQGEDAPQMALRPILGLLRQLADVDAAGVGMDLHVQFGMPSTETRPDW